MAYTKTKKKFHIETPAERAWIEQKLNVYKKWNKEYKGEITFKNDKSPQLFVWRSRYNTYDELNADAQSIIERMTKLDNSKVWTIISAKIVGQSVDDEEEISNV